MAHSLMSSKPNMSLSRYAPVSLDWDGFATRAKKDTFTRRAASYQALRQTQIWDKQDELRRAQRNWNELVGPQRLREYSRWPEPSTPASRFDATARNTVLPGFSHAHDETVRAARLGFEQSASAHAGGLPETWVDAPQENRFAESVAAYGRIAGQPPELAAAQQTHVAARDHLTAALADIPRQTAEDTHQAQIQNEIARYQRQLRLRPDDPDAWDGLGVNLWKQGNLTQAAAAFERGILVNASHLRLLTDDAALAMAQQDARRYRQRYTAALPQATPADPEFVILPFLAWLVGNVESDSVYSAIVEFGEGRVEWDFSLLAPVLAKANDPLTAKTYLEFFQGNISFSVLENKLAQ